MTDSKCYKLLPWLLFFVCFFHTMVGILKYFLPDSFREPFESILMVAFVVCAAVCIWRVKSDPALIKRSLGPMYGGADMIMFYIIIVWLFLSCLFMSISTGKPYFIDNSNHIYDSFITFLLIYPLGKLFARKSVLNKKAMMAMIHAFLFLWSAVLLIILINVFQGNILVLFDRYEIGMIDGVNFEINCNRNITAAIAITGLMISLYMLYKYTFRQWIWYAHLICAIINYVALVLSSSRTSILAGTVGFAAIIGVTVFVKLGEGRNKLLKSIPAGLFSGAVFFLMRFPVYKAYQTIYSLVTGMESSMVPRAILDASTATMSSRTTIWKHCIRFMMTPRPLLTGVTPVGVFEKVEDAMNIHSMPLNAHNEFLEIGVGLGIPALLAFIAWVVLIIVSCYRVYFVNKSELKDLIIPMIIMTMMIISLAESFFGFYENYIQFVFYFLCGYIYALGSKRKNEEIGRI